MRFNNEFELAYEMIEGKFTDPRQWGVLEDFRDTVIYRKFSGDMQDKYVRGQHIFKRYISNEYQDCEKECISSLIDFIKGKGLIFPLEMTSTLVYSDGWSCQYSTEFTTTGQTTLATFGVC